MKTPVDNVPEVLQELEEMLQTPDPAAFHKASSMRRARRRSAARTAFVCGVFVCGAGALWAGTQLGSSDLVAADNGAVPAAPAQAETTTTEPPSPPTTAPPTTAPPTTAPADDVSTTQAATQDLTIPELVGLMADDAIDEAKAQGLSPVVTFELNDVVPADQVIRTEPAAGEQLVEGELQIVVAMATPSEPFLPEVQGVTLDQASAQLRALGIEEIVVVTNTSPGQVEPIGTVIGTEPEAGTPIASLEEAGDAITVYVVGEPVDGPAPTTTVPSN